MAKGNSKDREARIRLRAYRARQKLHRLRARRRLRDNVIAAVTGVVVIALAVAAHMLYSSGGLTAPSTVPTPTTPGGVPSREIAQNREWTGTMTIDSDALGITLSGGAAPQAVSSFLSLTRSGFYNDVSCHRLTTEGLYVLQCGDPKGDGTGGPGYSYGPIENAPADGVYPAGTLAMARQGGKGDSQGSQFFIVYRDTTLPDDAAGGYTVIGHVTSGLDSLISDVVAKGVADGKTDGPPAKPVSITSISIPQ
ncbi:peptidylprolyl isomerase [Rathayibacter toxicus]|uniref:peptidylprolyl isomerase n=1 Tax=Rathayibacter toxicus TaxID=145458 RepID=UPI000CE8B13C|nr:peptidylprolyl isomerase [Rathayibacter toxicus]PPI54106.1 peptidylprolyl isomerase [Rathayibacter toxicus]QOD11199.1 peptidylprolyl isomerase [Rathayibacter toxicus]QWL30056.1 peptidylprolyl isomerase [Rathayibacter toxicus]